MRPSATSGYGLKLLLYFAVSDCVCGFKLLVYTALTTSVFGLKATSACSLKLLPSATSVCGLVLLFYAAYAALSYYCMRP